MSLEQMAYKMQPAGHDAPQEKRKYERCESNRKLTTAFERWLKIDIYALHSSPKKLADYIIKDLATSVEEVHALLLKYQDHKNFKHVGAFLTAVYDRVDDRIIIFDLNVDTQIDNIGRDLSLEKVLINKGTVGRFFGFGAVTVINYGQTARSFGQNTSGATINLGKIEDYPFTECEGYVINYTETPEKRKEFIEDILRCELEGKLWTPAEKRNIVLDQVLSQKYKMHELWDYLTELKDKLQPGKDDYKNAIEIVKSSGPEPGQKIKKDIDNIFERNGYNA